MSDRFEPLLPATLAFDADGVPVSPRYGDVYHARAGALAQARHVFLTGNHLPQRWQGKSHFTVGETGFGTGNNFLALWQAWQADPARCTRLHVLSFEAHPFAAADMALLAARSDPAVRALAQQLAAAWPVLTPGVHRLEFEGGAVTLTLFFGAIARTAHEAEARVDAFLLDGFAPERNPEMWTPRLFGQLRRLAAPGATLATWCAAGRVRRDLRAAGFLVERAPGFAGKHHMTVACLRPGLGRRAAPPVARAAPVAIVGAGFAGSALAHALGRRGVACVLIDPALAHKPAGVHQGHRAAALSPVATRDDDQRARVCRAGVLLAARLWAQLADARAHPHACGTLQLGLDAATQASMRAAVERLQFPPDWLQWLDRAQASQAAGLPLPHAGLYFPQGRVVRPTVVLPALTRAATHVCALVARLEHAANGNWCVLDGAGQVLLHAQTVVLACAGQVPAVLAASRPDAACALFPRMRHLGGQVAYMNLGGDFPAPRAIVAGKGYWLPPVDGLSTAGSTYWRAPAAAPSTLAPIAEKLASLCAIPHAVWQQHLASAQTWSGYRAAMADHLPVIGALPGMDGVWAACAFGSRGLAYAALAGEVIAAQLTGEPVPLERSLCRRIAPR